MIVIIVIAGYFFFFMVFPFMLIGPPCPLYYIANSDAQNHTVAIRVNDSTNKTIFFHSYVIHPDEDIEYNRAFGWYPTMTWTTFTWVEGKYTFYVVLDGNTTASHTTNVQYTQTIWIRIGFMGKPLEICEVWV